MIIFAPPIYLEIPGEYLCSQSEVSKYFHWKMKDIWPQWGQCRVLTSLVPSLWPDSFLVSGSVSQSGIIIGKKDKYVTRSLNVSGHDKSRGWLSSSSSPPPWKCVVLERVVTRTGLFSGVRQSEPQREHDGQEGKICDRSSEWVGGDTHVQGLRLNLLKLRVTALSLTGLLKHVTVQCEREKCASRAEVNI